MTSETAQDLVRARLKQEGVTLSRQGVALSPMEEAVVIREIAETLLDAAVMSPVRAEGSLTLKIKAQRWDEEPTAPVPEAIVARLARAM